MGFLTMATCHSNSHRIYDTYEIREEITRVLRNYPTYEPNNHLKGSPKHFRENFDPP
ncbi:uncharacterized protein G2W53_018220 [Senna tora]|uniref:Uncharacterized protein n=1 Tax=Senna tora TaxID=362788 RepID=A0A834TUT3_9FABA|nr:uncharacterized protein G2W53_018220 [Senna tora]